MPFHFPFFNSNYILFLKWKLHNIVIKFVYSFLCHLFHLHWTTSVHNGCVVALATIVVGCSLQGQIGGMIQRLYSDFTLFNHIYLFSIQYYAFCLYTSVKSLKKKKKKMEKENSNCLSASVHRPGKEPTNVAVCKNVPRLHIISLVYAIFFRSFPFIRVFSATCYFEYVNIEERAKFDFIFVSTSSYLKSSNLLQNQIDRD